MGKVGDDPFGQMVQLILRQRWGVSEGLIVDPAATTSYSVVLAPGVMDRMFLHCPGANDTFCAQDIDYAMVARRRLFHFGYPPLMRRMFERDGEELAQIFSRVHQHGVVTSLDMAMPDPTAPGGQAAWGGILARLGPQVDLCLPSAEEMMLMLRRDRYDALRRTGDFTDALTGDDAHALGQSLLDMGSAVVGLKVGHRGLCIRTAGRDRLARVMDRAGGDVDAWANREFWQPTFRVENLVNTTGSGDCTIAGFLAALLRGHSAQEAAALACAVGAFNVQAADSLGGLKEWDATLAAVQSQWPSNPLTVRGAGWRADANGRWIGPADRAD
jgi:sugar/nucleoside kinase (ribokinase family)